MATGMTNSSNTLSATSVLRSGEKIASTALSIKDKNAKTYFHSAAGARFVMPDGLEIIFMGGRFTTADIEIISELDKVANKSASLIWTSPELATSLTNNVKSVADEAANTAGKVTA